MKKILKWNVYREETGNGKIEPVNILGYDSIKKCLTRIRKEYRKYQKGVQENGYCETDLGSTYRGSVGEAFDKFFVREILEKRLRQDLMYRFWGKSECEVVITSWPPYITADVVDSIKQRNIEGKYREHVSLEVARKIDMYDQVAINWEPFIQYIWTNLFDANLR